VQGLVDLVARGVPLLGHPLAGPFQARLLDLLADLDPRREVKS
jgi:hypothetical protein